MGQWLVEIRSCFHAKRLWSQKANCPFIAGQVLLLTGGSIT